MSGKVCQVSGVVTKGENALTQQVVDDLLAIYSELELVCVSMRSAFEQGWITETLLDEFQRDQVQPEVLFHLIELHYAKPETRQTALLLAEQFCLNLTDSYRQHRLLRVLTIKCHHKLANRKWQQAHEMACYMLKIATEKVAFCSIT